MDLMITLSLLLNIAVLVPVCGGLLANAKWAVDVYGDATPARGILLAVYIAIGSVSLLLLVLPDPKPTAVLSTQSDVSLLPGVTRRIAQNLKNAGIQTWQQVIQTENGRLEQLGFDWRDLAHIRASSKRLAAGEAVLRYSIRSEEIINLLAVSIEFVDGYRGSDGHLLPRAVWTESPDGPVQIPLVGDGSWIARVGSLLSSHGAALYGATETVSFLKLLRQNNGPSVKCLDVLDLVESIVHGPIRGLELSNVLHVAEPGSAEPNNSRERVLGLRSVINWLAGSGGCAA